MRQVKFRAWDDHVKEMVFPLIQNPIKGWFTISGLFSTYDNDKLMQFTGLKDKNGKEIYEGDIINAFDNPTGMDNVKCVEVVYVSCAFRDSYNGFVLQDAYTEIEIIGNIYQDKHLLNEN